MNRQLSQDYLETSSRKRPSPALVSDEHDDATNDLVHRPEGNKFPKLIHYESHDTPVDIPYESLYGVSRGSQSLFDRSDSQNSPPNSVLDTNKNEFVYSSDAMTDIVREKTEPTCCFGMVGYILK